MYDRDGWKRGGREDCRQGLLSWVLLLHQTAAPANLNHPCAFLKVRGNDGGEPCVMAMSNHCFVRCQTLRVTQKL